MHIVVAPNSYKNAASASEAAAAMARGLRRSALDAALTLCPVGDGGDGTGALLLAQGGGESVDMEVRDALGRPIRASFGRLRDGRSAVIELADASGLKRLRSDERRPLLATTFGTGELLRGALERGARELVLCVGGSATTDGGCGLLRALGFRFLDAGGRELSGEPATLRHLARIDAQHAHPSLRSARLTVLCDVANPLLGPDGAASVFGPQKGASPDEVAELDAALARFSGVIHAQTGRDPARVPRGGAAGGVAAGLYGLLDATLVSGAEYFLEAASFDARVAGADVVVTGEGRIDEQTPAGKAPWAVASHAKAAGAFVIGLAGSVPLTASEVLRQRFDVLLAIGHDAMPLASAIGHTLHDLERTAVEIGNLLAFRRTRDEVMQGGDGTHQMIERAGRRG